ncbi:C25 family cysteine peptidase [Thermoplasmatota archaeon]
MKSITCFVVGLLLISSFAALSIGKEAIKSEHVTINFNDYIIKQGIFEKETYLEIIVDGANAISNHESKPLLPVNTNKITLPFGTKIIGIECKIGEIQSQVLNNKILPAPKKVVLGSDEVNPNYEMSEDIYFKNEFYPNNWFSYYLGGGLDENNEHKTFLNIRSYPLRYNPVTDTINFVSKIELKVNYIEPLEPMLTGNGEYDMVIITPDKLLDNNLEDLKDHKNNYGVQTIIKTLEDIYNEYTGVDKPEQIKYFIKDAIETWDIKYVMLVGGLKSPLWANPRDDVAKGVEGWHLPVRYTRLQEAGGTHDPGYISDLYYADIYDSEGNFSTWDLDRNGESDGIFANWKFGAQRDILDLYPDVYVGRLACRNLKEVEIVTNKIIDYETNTYGQDWFNKIIGVGGDSHDDSGTNFLEGEVACDHVFDTYMNSFKPVKLYSSYRTSDPDNIPSSENIIREISKGAGFLLFEGHGSPGSWNTHWPGEFNWADTPGGITCYDFPSTSNEGKYPIMVVGGCHNSQFNISYLSTILFYYLKDSPYMWTHGIAYAECFGWHMVRKIDGGSIASFGNTGLGYGSVGDHGDADGDGIDLPDTVEGVGGYQIVQFFKTYHSGVDILGEVWGGAEAKYLDTFPPMDDQIDCKTVEQWPLLGDPSLKIGGYSS